MEIIGEIIAEVIGAVFEAVCDFLFGGKKRKPLRLILTAFIYSALMICVILTGIYFLKTGKTVAGVIFLTLSGGFAALLAFLIVKGFKDR